MSEASFASLGPTLLARKGGAKPAMRPQLAPLPEVVAAEQLEDLGWNDMGADEEPTAPESATVVSITPATSIAANEDHADPFGTDSPTVKKQQQKLAEHVASDVVPASRKPAAKKSRKDSARRAAFTLRLDADRHLKLRLAATMQGVSAQALVTGALDALLEEIEDLDALAERFNKRTKHN